MIKALYRLFAVIHFAIERLVHSPGLSLPDLDTVG
jgi:hypothetical protein